MKDEKIKKRLEKCVKRGNRNYDTDIVLDLINRQKSEIERLKTENKIYIEANRVIGYQRDQRDKEIEELQKQIDGLDVRENKIKAEAYKEFAEKLKKEALSDRGYDILQQGTIDNLLKEMVGDGMMYQKYWERNGTRRPFPSMSEASKQWGEDYSWWLCEKNLLKAE